MSPMPFNARRFKELPLSEVIADFGRQYSVTLSSKGRTAYLAAIAPLDDTERTLVLLETLHQGMGRDGLHTLLFLSGGDAAPEMLPALQAAALAREAKLFAQALALFGPSYPADHGMREKLFGYHYSPELNTFDLRFLPIAAQFGDKARIGGLVEDYVRRTPALLRRMDVHRAAIANDLKLRWLQMELWREVDIFGSVIRMRADLARLPQDYRHLLLMGLFEVEFGNGGMDQIFDSETGALAPEIAAAFSALKLERHAAVLAKAIALFPVPYERDMLLRRASETAAHEEALHALTEEIYAIEDEAPYREAVHAFARAKGLIPR